MRDGIGQNLAGFPPFVAYRFEGTLPRAGTTAVSTDNDRLIDLQHLAGNTWQAGAWPAYHVASIPWRGEAMFQGQVSDQRELELERYRQLLAELVRANRLSTDDERRFAVPNLQITVVDRRTPQSRTRPALAP